VAFLATDLVDVTMLIAHHFPELRREAQTWPRVRAPRVSGSCARVGFLGVSMGGRRAILVASACNVRATCVQRAYDWREMS
jgi:dienelactone hydrolase